MIAWNVKNPHLTDDTRINDPSSTVLIIFCSKCNSFKANKSANDLRSNLSIKLSSNFNFSKLGKFRNVSDLILGILSLSTYLADIVYKRAFLYVLMTYVFWIFQALKWTIVISQKFSFFMILTSQFFTLYPFSWLIHG